MLKMSMGGGERDGEYGRRDMEGGEREREGQRKRERRRKMVTYR